MKSVVIMIKPASSLCDMRCKYCFYADVASMRDVKSYGIMSDETVSLMLDQLRREFVAGDKIQFTFQGGEPTLAGLPFFRNFVARVASLKGVLVSYALQTNGLHINQEWCAFLKKYNFLVGISLDVLFDMHDSVRVDAEGRGTYSRVIESIELMKSCGVDFNVLCTLTSHVAKKPKEVWKRIVELGIEYTQFTPCLGEFNSDSNSPYALTPELFASFYTEFFSCWYSDYLSGKPRSVKLFDDVVNQIVFSRPTGCGMDGICRAQLVVEADGSAFPCDFYCLDEYKLGNIRDMSVTELLSAPGVKSFVERPHKMPSLCNSCPYRRFCGGNCKRMQKEICCSGEDDFCGYRSFLDKCGETLFRLAERIRRSFLNK